MRTIFAEYNPHKNSIDIYTSAGYMLRIDCWEAEKNLKTTPGSDCALNAFSTSVKLSDLIANHTLQIIVICNIERSYLYRILEAILCKWLQG